MEGDLEALEQLNLQIGNLESVAAGEGEEAVKATGKLGEIVALHLGFRRAGGDVTGRDGFLNPERKNPARRDTEILSIAVYGNRAMVECIVTMGGKRYHNLRLFTRDRNDGSKWLLIGWANEEMPVKFSADTAPAAGEAAGG